MYVRQEALGRFPQLEAAQQRTAVGSLSRVHPEFYMESADPNQVTLRFTLRALMASPRALAAALKRRVRRGS
jgi:hypothetical protein